MLAIFWELSSEGLYQSSRKEKESCCPVFSSSTKREIRHFHVVVVQRRQRNVQKSVMHVQSCCFVNLDLLLYCRSRCRHRRRSLSSLALNSDALHSRHFQLSFPTFTWYEGDCNGTWANHEVLHLTYHKSDIGISVLEQPYLRTRHGEPELTQPRSKPQQRIKSQMTWKFFSPERGGVSPAGRTPIWKGRGCSSFRFGV